MTPAYNSNRYASHFRCKDTDFTKIYTCKNKTDAVDHADNFCQEVETQYNAKIRVMHIDGETSMGPRFDVIRKRRGFIVKITALGNSAQNSGGERLGKKFMIKSRCSRIEARLLVDMWPETVKTAGYISNRTPVKRLGWLTPFEALKGYKPKFAYLKNYGAKAYALDHHVPKS
jgi:hypothetical protein